MPSIDSAVVFNKIEQRNNNLEKISIVILVALILSILLVALELYLTFKKKK